MLSDITVKQAKPREKPFKIYDEKGLFIIVAPNGSKRWRFRYTFDGKEKTLSLGLYPAVTLANARKKAEGFNNLLNHHDDEGNRCPIDPGEVRKQGKVDKRAKIQEADEAAKIEKMIQAGEALPGSFEEVALEWFAKQESGWADSHSSKIINRLRADVFPYMGRTPIAEVTAPEVLRVLERIESRGTTDTAHRAKQNIGQIMRFAIATGRAKYDPVPSLRGALTPNKKNHFAAVTEPAQIAPLLRIMAGYRGSPITRAALTIAPLVFVRPGELRHMEWADIDFETAEWRYTASKTEQDHIVPLSRQVIEALREIEPLTGAGRYVFPGARSDTRPMSENTVNGALKRLGIDTQNELTGHGFRAMARTVLEEVHGFRPEVIELQLAHAVRDPLGRAYNRTKHLVERRRMMQVWADYLDTLRDSKNVVQGKFGKAG